MEPTEELTLPPTQDRQLAKPSFDVFDALGLDARTASIQNVEEAAARARNHRDVQAIRAHPATSSAFPSARQIDEAESYLCTQLDVLKPGHFDVFQRAKEEYIQKKNKRTFFPEYPSGDARVFQSGNFDGRTTLTLGKKASTRNSSNATSARAFLEHTKKSGMRDMDQSKAKKRICTRVKKSKQDTTESILRSSRSPTTSSRSAPEYTSAITDPASNIESNGSREPEHQLSEDFDSDSDNSSGFLDFDFSRELFAPDGSLLPLPSRSGSKSKSQSSTLSHITQDEQPIPCAITSREAYLLSNSSFRQEASAYARYEVVEDADSFTDCLSPTQSPLEDFSASLDYDEDIVADSAESPMDNGGPASNQLGQDVVISKAKVRTRPNRSIGGRAQRVNGVPGFSLLVGIVKGADNVVQARIAKDGKINFRVTSQDINGNNCSGKIASSISADRVIFTSTFRDMTIEGIRLEIARLSREQCNVDDEG